MAAATLTEETAIRFAEIALGHVTRPFPTALSLRLTEPADLVPHEKATPIFFGSFDWHSCVHGYWLLARLRRLFPQSTLAAPVAALFDLSLTAEKVAAECAYLAKPENAGFERPYGWAWVLMLASELHRDPKAKSWAASFQPLADLIVARFTAYLPRLTYAVRTGMHSNSAFALILAHSYADRTGDKRFKELLDETALHWFGSDEDCRAWGEPSGEDFLSPSLCEAVLMRRVLGTPGFARWFARFLPDMPKTLTVPVQVSDRSDGRIAHLDGLNFSRAWALRHIAAGLKDTDRADILRAADDHIAESLPHLASDYMGEHWLATFALLALTETD